MCCLQLPGANNGEQILLNNCNCNSHFLRSVNSCARGGKEGDLDMCGQIFVLLFYVRVVSGNRTGKGSQVGIVVDGQTCGIPTPRLVGLTSLSVQQVNRSPSQLKRHRVWDRTRASRL